jgi:hypothetical protein
MLIEEPIVRTQSASAAPKAVPAIARVLPSLTDLAFLMPVIFLFARLEGARTLLGDGDTGWHVLTGQWILDHGQVPFTDMFSFSRPGAPWFAWEWLWDALFAVLFRAGGMAAVVATSIAVICFTNLLLFRLIRRACNNGLVAIAVTLLATGACSIHWLARPHLFTLLFLAVTLHLTERAAEGRVRLLAWLPPLTLLWTNLHGGFFVVLLVLASYIAGTALNAVIDADPAQRRAGLRTLRPWGLAFLGCVLVTFVNPYGWQLHRHIFEYITDPYQLLHIGEFQSMNFHAPVTRFVEPMALLAVLASLWHLRQRRFAAVFLSLGFLHLAMVAQRNIPLFAIAAGPAVAAFVTSLIAAAKRAPLAGWIPRAAEWMENSAAGFDQTDRLWRVHLVSALPMIALTALLISIPPRAGAKNTKLVSTYDPDRYPEAALPLLRSPETHRIFADDEWGDYLLYNLYPQRKVFIDGRSDFYGDDFGEKYLDALNAQYGWEKLFDKYAFDTAVVSPKLPLTGALKLSPDWRLVYDDHISLVFRRAHRATGSPASSGGGNSRDRAIAGTPNRDPEATQPNT